MDLNLYGLQAFAMICLLVGPENSTEDHITILGKRRIGPDPPTGTLDCRLLYR